MTTSNGHIGRHHKNPTSVVHVQPYRPVYVGQMHASPTRISSATIYGRSGTAQVSASVNPDNCVPVISQAKGRRRRTFTQPLIPDVCPPYIRLRNPWCKLLARTCSLKTSLPQPREPPRTSHQRSRLCDACNATQALYNNGKKRTSTQSDCTY